MLLIAKKPRKPGRAMWTSHQCRGRRFRMRAYSPPMVSIPLGKCTHNGWSLCYQQRLLPLSSMNSPLTVGLLLGRQLQGALEGRNARGFPFLPHLVHHALDVLNVLLNDVGEAALLHEIVPHWDTLLAGVVGIDHLALDDLIQREDPRADTQLTQLVGIPGVVVPALGAGVEAMNEGRTANGEGLADFI